MINLLVLLTYYTEDMIRSGNKSCFLENQGIYYNNIIYAKFITLIEVIKIFLHIALMGNISNIHEEFILWRRGGDGIIAIVMK